MYLGYADSCALAGELAKQSLSDRLQVAIFPSALAFESVHTALAESDIKTGAQNVAWTPNGAYTGAISAEMFAEVGAEYALVGHSERRHLFGETNRDIKKKIEAILAAGMRPVLCVGETKEDLDAGKGEYRIKKQLFEALDGVDLSQGRLFVAYEPVWAISQGGQGMPCEPDQAQKMHLSIKELLREMTSQSVPVLYGGSVDGQNVVSFVSQNDIDGVLVGSASTKADSFVSLLSTLTS